MNLMTHRGYLGSVEFDQDERIFYGKLEFIRGLVSYEATDAEGLIGAFCEAVDDYLADCEARGTPPEKPLKGSFNVRVGPDLHRRAAIAAAQAGISLNAFTAQALEAALNAAVKPSPAPASRAGRAVQGRGDEACGGTWRACSIER